MQQVVFLDRDGVINIDSDAFVKSPEEWQPIPGSMKAMALLSQAGFKVVVATNQSGIGRGLFGLDALDAMHAKMQQLLQAEGGELAGIYFCPHVPDIHCDCRKPKPGLLKQFSAESGIPLAGQFLVGDAWRDLETAWAVGVTPLLVKTGKGLTTLAEHPELTTPVFADLRAATDYLLQNKVA